jgi:hypothetical protein
MLPALVDLPLRDGLIGTALALRAAVPGEKTPSLMV